MAAKPSRPGSPERHTAPEKERRGERGGRSRSIPQTRTPDAAGGLGSSLPNLSDEEDDEQTEFAHPGPWAIDDTGRSTPSPPGEFTLPDFSAEADTDSIDGCGVPLSDEHTRPIFAPEAPFGPSDFERRYQLIGPLGEGGMGEIAVYLDRQMGREVAIKTIHSDAVDTERMRRRFAAEARVQGQLEHPAIVPVYDLGVDGAGQHYFTMQRIRGVSLEDVISRLARGDDAARSEFPRRRLVAALATLCLALDLAHRRGVLHRDLKPANVMLGEFGEVHLLDWGVARVNDEDVLAGVLPDVADEHVPAMTMPGAVVGSLGYMSPEQLRGAGAALTPAADVYALGALLFEICTLQRLHEGESFGELTLSTLGGVEARPSIRAPHMRVPPLLEQIIVRATAQKVEDRYDTARALYRALQLYLDDERDEDHRIQLALGHARAAKRSLRRAGTNIDERRRAIREVGRALALDPDNGFAAQSLRTLLDTPPAVPIAEVDEALERASTARLHWFSRLAALGYLSFLLFLPLVAYMGVRNWALIGVGFLGSFAAAVLSYSVGARKLGPRTVVAVAVVSSIALGSTAAMFGPLVLTPAFIGMNTTGFAITLSGGYRRAAVAAGIVTVLATIALGLAGVLPGGYQFTDGDMLILPGSLDLPATPAMLLLTIASLVSMWMPVHLVSRLRDELHSAERRQILHSWHLGELLPSGQRPSSDGDGSPR